MAFFVHGFEAGFSSKKEKQNMTSLSLPWQLRVVPKSRGGGAGKTFSSVGKALQPAMLVYENPNGKLFESDYASCPLYCKLADAHLYISRP